MSSTIPNLTGYALGQSTTHKNPKNLHAILTAMKTAIDNLEDGTISTTDLTLTGDLTVGDDSTFTGDIYVGGIVKTNGTPQTLTGAGAVNLTTHTTLLVTTGANALTLAAGAEGQYKFIRMKTDGGDGTLTVTNLQGGTTLTFNAAGDFVHLYYVDAKWHILTNSGATLA